MTDNPERTQMKPKEKVNILMVDDQPGKLLSYEAILESLDENLIKATSGREALEYLLKSDIAVILMDVSMPELDGFEVAEMIRQHPRFHQTAIIFISAVHLTDLDKLKGYERGAVDYVSVPIVPELLRAKVSVFAELHRKASQLEAAEEGLRQLSRRLMKTQDEERRRIARELHDSLGQYLAAAKMTLDHLRMRSDNNSDTNKALADAAEQIETAIIETRTLSYLLHPPLLDEIGIASALAWYVEGFAKRSGIAVDLHISPTFGRLVPEAETALFRVVQECLTNVHRHSGSSSATISLTRESGELRLEVRDRGKGMPRGIFVSGVKCAELGVGMQGIHERVRHLQGQMEVRSEEGKGTVITVTVPDAVATLPSTDAQQKAHAVPGQVPTSAA
jgi:signal transduction histidine kinase